MRQRSTWSERMIFPTTEPAMTVDAFGEVEYPELIPGFELVDGSAPAPASVEVIEVDADEAPAPAPEPVASVAPGPPVAQAVPAGLQFGNFGGVVQA